MRGCVLFGLVTFHDGVVPYPEWPLGTDPSVRAAAEAALKVQKGSGAKG